MNPVNTDRGLKTDQMGHILYCWKDIEKFYPVKMVRAWTIYMASCKIQFKLSIFVITRILLNPVNTDWGLKTDQMRHTLYRWKDKKKFHPVNVVGAWTIIWQASKSS